MSKFFKKETKIGLCVAIALGVLFFGIEYLKGVNLLKPGNNYYAVYSNVKGLTESAPVTVSGLKVGQVNKIELIPDSHGKVLVTLSLKKNFMVPLNSRALLDSDLLGTASIVISLGDGPGFYNIGDTIPSAQNTGLMDNITSDVLPAIGDIAPKIDSVLTNINNVVADSALINTIHNLESFTRSINSTATALNRTVGQIPDVVGDIKGLVDNLNKISADINELTDKLANAPIDTTLQNINEIAENLSGITKALNDPDSNVGRLINESGLYQNILDVTTSINDLLKDIQQNPKRYINIKLL